MFLSAPNSPPPLNNARSFFYSLLAVSEILITIFEFVLTPSQGLQDDTNVPNNFIWCPQADFVLHEQLWGAASIARGSPSPLSSLPPCPLWLPCGRWRWSRFPALLHHAHPFWGQKKNNKLNIVWPKMAHLGPRFSRNKYPRKSLCRLSICALWHELRHMNFLLGAQSGGFWVGSNKFTLKKVYVLSMSLTF